MMTFWNISNGPMKQFTIRVILSHYQKKKIKESIDLTRVDYIFEIERYNHKFFKSSAKKKTPKKKQLKRKRINKQLIT